MTIKFKLLSIIISVFCLGIFNTNANSQEKNPSVLVVTGGHNFDHEAFYNMFNSFPIKWKEKSHPDVLPMFESGTIEEYDVLVFYDMPDKIIPTDGQKKAILNYFKNGAAAVFFHHSLLSYPTWDEFIDIIGGRYFKEETFVEQAQKKFISDYQHDQNINVFVEDKDHPVCEGIFDFKIFDEVYGNCFVLPTVKPLLTTDHPASNRIIAWTNTYENSQIVYFQGGHDAHAFQDQNFRKLLQNAIQWVNTANH